MSYLLQVLPSFQKSLDKFAKRNRRQFEIVQKKMSEVIENPQHYKNLKAPLNFLKRVHIDKSFVLLFSVDEREKRVVFEGLEHHDEAYLPSY
ncbi:type II toxin-antitoxin system RelE/ParE family toxin [Candidatus Woesearchaeota archaeon]|nr:type II toxin-antitoxin system RelE/ParE family toxin [Candidatus Woesearchaeota archaeon]